MSIVNLTKADMLFFMDMVGSGESLHFKPRFYRTKPYYKILDDPDSDEYRRFIKVYHETKHILKKRDRQILDAIALEAIASISYDRGMSFNTYPRTAYSSK